MYSLFIYLDLYFPQGPPLQLMNLLQDSQPLKTSSTVTFPLITDLMKSFKISLGAPRVLFIM